MSEPQDWTTKIAAMLAKANGKGTTPEEARIYQEKAAYLMNKLGIKESEIRMTSKSDEKPANEIFKKFPPYADSKLELLEAVTVCLGGKIVNIPSTGEMHVFAFSGDLERIRTMYFSLLAQMHIEAALLKFAPGVKKRAYTGSWLKGFVYGVRTRMRRAYSKANEESNALVIYDRDSKVRDAMHDVYKNLKTRKASAVSDSQGFNDGVESGLRADVGQDRFGKTAGQRAIGGTS